MNRPFYLLSNLPYDSQNYWSAPSSYSSAISSQPNYLKQTYKFLFGDRPDAASILHRTQIYFKLVLASRYNTYLEKLGNLALPEVSFVTPVISGDLDGLILIGEARESIQGKLSHNFKITINLPTVTIEEVETKNTNTATYQENSVYPLGFSGLSFRFKEEPSNGELSVFVIGTPVDAIANLTEKLNKDFAPLYQELFSGDEVKVFKDIYDNTTNYVEKIVSIVLSYLYKMDGFSA